MHKTGVSREKSRFRLKIGEPTQHLTAAECNTLAQFALAGSDETEKLILNPSIRGL
jgi:hypothetical protein